MKIVNFCWMLFFCLPLFSTLSEYKIAVIGDSGKSDAFKQVLKLIKDQKASLVLHAGDLGYDELNINSPKEWNDVVNKTLGKKFPYFFVIGNHDVIQWFGFEDRKYQEILKKRVASAKLDCKSPKDTNLGIKTACNFKDLLFVASGVGTIDTNHEAFIENTFKNNPDAPWKICLWHKNQRDFQPGDKPDEVGFGVYQSCQKHGAMILTGHEHSYGRTYTLTDIGNRTKAHGKTGQPDIINLGPSSTFVAVSGLGGHSNRPYDCKIHEDNTWWASIVSTNYTKINENDTYGPHCKEDRDPLKNNGALFITFNYQGDSKKALGEFISTNNKVLDSFIITR